MISKWSFPTTIFSGAGAAQQVGEEAARLGGKAALIVTDKGVHRAGLLEPIVDSLKAAGLVATVVDGISPNPLEAEALEAVSVYQESGADLIIGVGGGSPIDAAKIVRLLAAHPPPLSQYEALLGGDALIHSPLPPMIAIPTTAGSGSEVSAKATLTLQAGNRKASFSSWRLLPDVALLDPELSRDLSPRLTAITGMDALTRSIEAYCALGNHPMAEAIALRAIELTQRYLEEAVQDGQSLEAREKLLEAAMMSGVASRKGLGAATSLARPLNARFGLQYGLASAICLPPVIEFNRMVAPEKLARIAKTLGVRSDEQDTLAFEASGALRKLRKRIGLEEALSDLSIPEEELPELASLAAQDEAHQANPRPASEEDLLSLYRSAF